MPAIECDLRHTELAQLLGLWQHKRKGKLIPTWRDFSVCDLRSWLGHLALLEVVSDGNDFLFRVWGTHLAAQLGNDYTGALTSDLPDCLKDFFCSLSRSVHRTSKPIRAEARFTIKTIAVNAEILALPLSNGSARVDRILMGIYNGSHRYSYLGVHSERP